MIKANARIRLQLTLTLLISSILLLGCAQNRLNDSWADSEYHGPIEGPVLVIGVFKDSTAHKIYEDSFVAKLQTAGVKAIPSHQFNLQTPKPSAEKIRQVVQQTGATSILYTHLLSENTKSFEFLSTRYAVAGVATLDGAYGYHSTIYAETFGGSETVDKTTDLMATVLFDVKSGKLIWSAHSKSVNLNNMVRADDERLEALFIKDMKAHNIL